MVYIPGFRRNLIIKSMDMAEELKKAPANTAEIFVVMLENYSHFDIVITIQYPWFAAYLQNMYREDLFYADPNFTAWTTKSEDDNFEMFSDRFRRLYPGYLLD